MFQMDRDSMEGGAAKEARGCFNALAFAVGAWAILFVLLLLFGRLI